MPTVAQEAPLTVQENALAAAMAGHIGDVTLQYTVTPDGDRLHDTPRLQGGQFDTLVDDFRKDPKEALAWARESLLSIQDDTRLTAGERSKRLHRYLDAYCSLTLKLDHKAFPPTRYGQVQRGVPEYIPDGFADLGGEKSLDAAHRNREMISVNKYTIFERYKPVLKEIFSTDYSQYSPDGKKQAMFTKLAQAVYFNLPYDHKDKALGGGKVDLGGLSEGVCRHQAMTFQILAQAVGLTARVLKSNLSADGKYLGRHAANMIRVNHKWYVLDATNPDYVTEDGRNIWRPGIIRADRPPHPGESKLYEGTYKHNGKHHAWEARDDMYWIID